MIQTIEAPNGAGTIKIVGSRKKYTLETSFSPFGKIDFIEELEKRMSVKQIKRTNGGQGIYTVFLLPELNPEGLTITELVTDAAEESKVFDSLV